MKLRTVALVGQSVRPLAQAAVRAGWRVVAIDNFAVSHGRLPYSGPRLIAVAWA